MTLFPFSHLLQCPLLEKALEMVAQPGPGIVPQPGRRSGTRRRTVNACWVRLADERKKPLAISLPVPVTRPVGRSRSWYSSPIELDGKSAAGDARTNEKSCVSVESGPGHRVTTFSRISFSSQDVLQAKVFDDSAAFAETTDGAPVRESTSTTVDGHDRAAGRPG